MSEENIIESENEEIPAEDFVDEATVEEIEETSTTNRRRPDINRADNYNRMNQNRLNSRRQNNINSQQRRSGINSRNRIQNRNQQAKMSSNLRNTHTNQQNKGLGNGLNNLLGSKKDGKFTINIPIKYKIILVVAIIAILIFSLMFFIVLFGNGDNSAAPGMGSGTGLFMYGETCTTITVIDTGCDSNGENCTNIYDGEVDLEEYIAGVVAAEVGDANNLEYYKAVAVAARTYVLSNISDDCTISGNSSGQSYMDVDDSSNKDLIRKAVEETEELVLTENENLVELSQPFSCAVKYDVNNCSSGQEHKMTQSEAISLINAQNYNYDDLLKHYYGSNVEINENILELSGIDGFVNPTRTIYCSSAYGNRTDPIANTTEFHSGLDIAIPGGEPIYAAQDGIISALTKDVTAINDSNGGYGNYIIIDHEDGTSTLYAHMKYGSIPDSLVVGEQISQGEQIGQVGSTGRSTGNHLHYEVKVNGSTVDPALYLDLTDATGECQR